MQANTKDKEQKSANTSSKGIYNNSVKRNEHLPFTARLIPYFAFANRGESDMLVWIRRHK